MPFNTFADEQPSSADPSITCVDEGSVDHLLDGRSAAELSESNSKSSCAFPMIIRAASVVASSRSRRSLRRLSLSSSTWSGVRLVDRSVPVRPASEPLALARRHW